MSCARALLDKRDLAGGGIHLPKDVCEGLLCFVWVLYYRYKSCTRLIEGQFRGLEWGPY